MSRGVVKPCTPTLQCAEDSQSITSYVLPHNHSYYLTAVYQVNIRTTTQAEYNQLHLFTHTVTSSRAGVATMWARGEEEWSQEKKGFVTSVRCSGPCQYRSLSPLFTAKLTCFLRHIHNGWQAKISDYSAANFTKYHFSFNAQLFSRINFINNTLHFNFNFISISEYSRTEMSFQELCETKTRGMQAPNACSGVQFWK